MNKLYTEKKNQKDIEKGQKIIAAVLLATRHMSDSDPLKDSIKLYALECVSGEPLVQDRAFQSLSIVLGGAGLSGVLSEKNASIILNEIKHFIQLRRDSENDTTTIDQLFFDPISTLGTQQNDTKRLPIKKTEIHGQKSYGVIGINPQNDIQKTTIKNDKFSRQQKILSFINDRKSAVIKDITALFPDVSEKTLQRELTALIDAGRITKRGSKRWSIYMAVNTLI